MRKNLDLKTGTGLTIRDNIQLIVDDDNKLKTIDDYLKKMSKNKKYGGQDRDICNIAFIESKYKNIYR